MIASLYGRAIRKFASLLPLTDIDEAASIIVKRARKFSMTSPERLYSVIQSVRYVVAAGVPGDFVECGVWRGGSTMAAALTLLSLGRRDMKLHLFDTFEGMTAPTDRDIDYTGVRAAERFARRRTRESSKWCYASLEDVRANLAGTGYEMSKVDFVKGRVEDTIPEAAPRQISILRLDTDWYESTRHELEHLYPRLSPGGVLIIDDYGHWQGSRQATDEYFAKQNSNLLLSRIDSTGRMGLKPATRSPAS